MGLNPKKSAIFLAGAILSVVVFINNSYNVTLLYTVIIIMIKNQNILCNPDPKSNRPIKSHVGIRPRTDM
jgi:hypothetical protein